ncbi:hypothetical protein QE364_000876 [Nocardioides zeae]|uniref:Uncharacterized protein n=2 Tax=Nocardioides zeae TaxID=1457234 RepID=A0AAJ1U892_9ACTN|nr:hypothetical protein [Nocardioides zeae]MDQ1105977.1 hypothetical protein [Nocardioides zeae]MDR6174379.1 hypothetical protein [Nocardioides zeae]MDR6209184.1 hypothetical protein [Nocardioides zeae]
MSAVSAAVTAERGAPADLARPVVTLTDEELAVLGHAEGPAVTPYLADLTGAVRDQALATALRGLLARGIVSPPGGDGAPELQGDRVELDLLVRQDVLSVLTLRRAAGTVVAVARTGAAVQDFLYAHVVAEFVLVEQVGTDGQHRFSLARAADLGALLVGAVLHPEAASGTTGDPVTLSVPAGDVSGPAAVAVTPPALLAQLGTAHLRADVTVLRAGSGVGADGPGELLGLFTGPRGCWVARTAAGSGRVRIAPVDVEQVRRDVRALAADAVPTPESIPESGDAR